ncbi:hypothetical protein MUK42_05239 [Musa troglodytarum]|uniref:Uncharacterized protein n=1 Tax=Musa troglodytarum TaxID=320322 RepID=A0A9E7F4B7_9LILI|nr:hypothetical protein MUK42_05239 [Musa troglodytarum]
MTTATTTSSRRRETRGPVSPPLRLPRPHLLSYSISPMPANSSSPSPRSSPSSAAAPHRTVTVFPGSPSGVNLCTSGSMILDAGRAQDDRGPRWGFLLRSTWFTPCPGEIRSLTVCCLWVR